MLPALLILLMITACKMQTFTSGPCHKLIPQPDFNVTKFLGKWYTFAEVWPDGPMGNCWEVEYVADRNNSKMVIEKSKFLGPDGLPMWKTAFKLEYMGNAKWFIRNSIYSYVINQTAVIRNTDYTSYALKVICENIGQNSLYFASILTKSRHPSSNVIARIDEALRLDGIPEEFFSRVNSTNCPQNS